MPGESAEIIRLRDRVHTLTSTCSGLELKLEILEIRVEAQEQWRRVYQPLVDEMTREREIRAAVKAQTSLQLTWLQKIGAAVIGGLTAADLVTRLVT